ncbi:Cu+-exporting ATPase [Ruminococcaceae bacterium FB2012]|nr:Cu+-exporting ATPase [Ruminococcaceae bacterium FB2012]
MSDKRSIENMSDELDGIMDRTRARTEEVSPVIPEEESRSRAERNADEISRRMQERRARGEVSPESEETPVKLTDVSEIDMQLTGKILERTGEYERAVDIPNDLSYEERSEMLRKARSKKVDAFKLKRSSDEADKDDGDESGSRHSGQHEFENYGDEKNVLRDILQVKSNLTVRMCVLLFAGIFTLLLALANDLSLPLVTIFDKVENPSTFMFTNTILGIAAIAVSYTVIVEGMKNLFRGRADCDSLAAAGILITVLTGIITLFEPSIVRQQFYHVYTTTAIFGLVFNTLGKLMIVKRTERNFRFVAEGFDKYAVATVDDEDIAGKMTGGVLNDFPELAAMRKTEFIKDFMKNSYSTDVADLYSRRMTPIILIVSLAVGLLSLAFEKSTAGTTERIFNIFGVVSGTITLCSSLSLMLIVNIPLGRAQNKYLRYSGVMLGYSAVDKFSDTNSVLIDAEQLFPRSMVDIKNLKLIGSTKIEECILYAASLSCQAGSILSSAFYKILRGKTEMLCPVESYIYEDGLGLSGWIENKRVLLGSRQLMMNHSIEGLPTLAKEEEYAKGNFVLYLSVSGVVSMLFVVEAKASLSVSKWLRELGRNGIVSVIRTVDGFIDREFVSKLFDVDPDMIKLLPFRFHKDYLKETDYTPEVSSPMLCSGHFPSFAMLLTGTKRLKQISTLGVAIQAGACVLGFGISLVMTLLGTFGQLTPTFIFIYNMAFLLITIFAQKQRV